MDECYKWISVTNFFDIDPIMSDNGEFTNFYGSSSEIIVIEALKFIEKNVKENKPFFTVIWDGSPHDPFVASEEDKIGFENLNKESKEHYGEIVAFDKICAPSAIDAYADTLAVLAITVANL